MSAHFLRHTAIISVQVIFLAFGYGFLGAVLYYGYLYPSERVSNLWKNHPEELTMVITLIATMLSVTASMSVYPFTLFNIPLTWRYEHVPSLFTLSMKDALRHRISRSISLVNLSAGVALSKGSYILRPEYFGPTTLTLFVFGVLRLLTAGWTTLLTPTYFPLPIQMQGSELDMTGNVFNTLLLQEFQAQGLTYFRNDAFEVLDIGGMLSGISAAGQTYGLPGTFNFNGAKYNVSTGGIVPTIEEYSGSNGVPGPSCTRLGFSDGNVTVNTGEILGKRNSRPIPQGFSRNYSMLQQGLTANVSCQLIDSSDTQYIWNPNSTLVYSNATAGDNTIAGLRLRNVVGTCGANTSMTQAFVIMADASGNASQSSGFLPSVVCPGPMNLGQTYTNFSEPLKYGFLGPSVCEVTPLLTTVRANYSSDIISSEVISYTPFRSENVQLLSFIAGVAKFQSISSQGLMSSTIGDTLYSIYSSTTNATIGDNLGSQLQVYDELEDYCRGVVEFSATFLRSGFMVVGGFPDNTIPVDLQSPVNGTMYISTIGWTWRSGTYLLAIIPITIITILTFACVLYSYLHAQPGNGGSRTTFDASSTLHLVMASAAGDLTLEDFGKYGIIKNEGVEVRLQETDNNVKKFVEVKK
ncbi:hypothetical protein BDR04DRAFT_1161543 [Suillus decipiens]|nr:hypothetical protein BDR04DRAFT_1161543 [Suillus decipiens]